MDWFEYFWISDAQHSATQARTAAAGAERRVAELQLRLDRTVLVVEALWTILRDRLGVSDEEMASAVQRIDLADGALDGKVRRKPTLCSKCSRPNAPRFPKCIYCQAPLAHESLS